MHSLYEFEIKGRIPSKKNNKRIVNIHGRPIIISSDQHNEWHKQAEKQLESLKNEGIDYPIHVHYEFYMPDNRKCDISNKIESINDLLTDIGFWEDDNWKIIKSFSAKAQLDHENPGCKISINRIGD